MELMSIKLWYLNPFEFMKLNEQSETETKTKNYL